jgi:hypothetical protein
MKTKIEQIQAKSDWLMSTLKQHPSIDDTWQITINFANYALLYGTVADLMKLCTIALTNEEMEVSPLIPNPKVNLANIMELAIQLLPASEMEFLDNVRCILSEETPNIQKEKTLEYNYSTMRILIPNEVSENSG